MLHDAAYGSLLQNKLLHPKAGQASHTSLLLPGGALMQTTLSEASQQHSPAQEAGCKGKPHFRPRTTESKPAF